MSNEALKFVFANAISAIFTRADYISLSDKKRDLCRSFAVGFGLFESDGDNIYTHSIETNNFDISGFGPGSFWEIYENNVLSIIANDSRTSSLSAQEQRVLAAAANSIIFGFSSNLNLTPEDLYQAIGETLVNVSERILGISPYPYTQVNGKSIVSHPFNGATIRYILSLNNYSLTSRDIADSPKTVDMDIVNYNWYDTTNLFSGPNLDLLKDSENQYYYLSGSLTYSQLPSGIVFCETGTSTIETESGPKTITIYKNQPCVDINSYIGPKTGVKFYREFNDGPYSSGDFSEEVKEAFINWDKDKLSKSEYFSNLAPFYSFSLINGTGNYAPIFSQVQYDAQGEYNINQEYKYAPMPYDCAGSYQVMRVGDARKRAQCSKFDLGGNCIECKDSLTTGFKFALLELDHDIWEDRLAYSLTNPPTTTQRTAKRGLNISDSPYISYELNGELISARPDLTYDYVWYIGPPQHGDNQLPFLAFTQSFHSLVFGSGASINLYPAIGSAGAGGEDSSRTYSISPNPIISGKDNGSYSVLKAYENGLYPKVIFNEVIKSYVSGDDDIKGKFFGMGNAFSGKYSIKASQEENAGYFYSGYIFTSGKTTYTGNEINLIAQNIPYRIGSPYNQIKYISGYSGYGNLIGINRMYAHDYSGNNMEYYYFDNRLLPNGVSVKQTGWTEFAQLPTELESDSEYKRQYAYQDVENKNQRYYKGPYASYVNKFLYPNAKSTSIVYNAASGFPNKFKYKIRVREETIKEIYCKFQISQGISLKTPTFIPVVRPIESNFGAPKPTMISIFSAGGYNFDFNQWNIKDIGFKYNLPLTNAVDNEYAPATDFYNPTVDAIVYIYTSGKNGLIYENEPEFSQGILTTGKDAVLHRTYSGNLYRESGLFWFSPSPTAVGLYHNFSGYEITGYLTYTKPIYDLESGMVDRNQMIKSLPLFSTGCTEYKYCPGVGPCSKSVAEGINKLYTKQLDGKIFYSERGNDPFFFKDMGGRTGSNTATGQGGYHPKGIIGDNWIGLNARRFGYYCAVTDDVCGDDYNNTVEKNYGIEAFTNDNRIAEDDRNWFLINATPTGAKIYTRALEYNPMAYDYVNRPYSAASTAPASNSAKISLTFQNSSSSFNFDLGNYFTVRPLTSASEWYINPSGSGLIIGPFDRDVELFVDSGRVLTGYNYLYINQRKISDFASGSNDGTVASCIPPKKPSGTVIDYWLGDFKNIKPLIFIPSGDSATINVKGIETGGYPFGSVTPTGSLAPCNIGFPKNSYINIRARKTLNESIYSDELLSYFSIRGSNYWLHNRKMINNGSERTFDLPIINNDIKELKGNAYSFTTYSRSGKLYPKPNTSEFITYKTTDKAGNDSYTIKDVDEFYRKKTANENSSIYYSGWREGSRISFEFIEMEPLIDSLPYQSHTIMIPSGDCIVSGEMGYLSQADNAVFSEGVSLSDETPNDLIKDNIYGPKYVSKILERAPMFAYPSGTYINPVLEAPSVMKQRLVTETISPEQEYSGINNYSPYNYNKFLWPALSDLKKLNPNETLEDLAPDDGNTFLNSTMLISASQGQELSNGDRNPDARKLYVVRNQYQFYDSVSTDSSINPEFITSGFGFQTQLNQPISGALVPRGTTLTEIVSGYISI